jgi:hypothetical protein
LSTPPRRELCIFAWLFLGFGVVDVWA